MKDKILVIGSSGQIGTELVMELGRQYGVDNVVAADLKLSAEHFGGPFEVLDVMNRQQLGALVKKHEITQVYLLAALLSATAEKDPMFAWKLNMDGLFNVLELNCGVWSQYPERSHSSIYCDGTQYRLWDQQAGW
jgi:nucleoside-diphosphate-sugar epimerase